jgi:hypothetical protein
MAFLVSPGVEVKEIDLSDIIPSQSTSIGGYAGLFKWGPAETIVNVGSEKELASIFAAPTSVSSTDAIYESSFLTASSFLKYGNFLKVSRALDSTCRNAINEGSIYGEVSLPGQSYRVTSVEQLEARKADFQDDDVRFLAKYAGEYGDSLKVYFIDSAAYGFSGMGAVPDSVKGLLTYTPGTTVWAEEFTPSVTAEDKVLDEVAIVIVDESGKFTGAPGTALEIYEGLSLAVNSKNEYGESNYWVTKINQQSSYIYGVAWSTDIILESTDDNQQSMNCPTSAILEYGSDHTGTLAATSITNAIGLFADAETVDVNLLFAQNFTQNGGVYTGTLTAQIDSEIIEVVSNRKDCLGFISAPLDVANLSADSDKLDSVKDKFDSLASNSYLVFDSTPVYVYNKYNDRYVWIPASGHMAGLCAKTDGIADPWFSPAGFNRGALLGVTKLAYNPKQADRDTLYTARINPIVSIPGQGIVLYGDKTGLSKPSAFDRINVRRLFLTIEKAIATAAKFQLFELNDEFTRATFRNAVEPYLRTVQGRRGITDFRVICDESNNTPDVIDGNRFVASIYIKPARSINFITLNFIATRTGVAFEELVGR